MNLLEVLRTILAALYLFTCPDTQADPGGVRCASTLAPVVVPPWKSGEQAGAAFLRRTAELESHSRPVGVHANDARVATRMWLAAVRAGWLAPDVCPGHGLAAGGRKRGQGVRGAWGASAAYTLRHLGPIGCWFGPAVLDWPPLGALAAAGHLRHCVRVKRTRDPIKLRACWAGAHKAPAHVEARWRRG